MEIYSFKSPEETAFVCFRGFEFQMPSDKPSSTRTRCPSKQSPVWGQELEVALSSIRSRV